MHIYIYIYIYMYRNVMAIAIIVASTAQTMAINDRPYFYNRIRNENIHPNEITITAHQLCAKPPPSHQRMLLPKAESDAGGRFGRGGALVAGGGEGMLGFGSATGGFDF
jgi:hypothetical protein